MWTHLTQDPILFAGLLHVKEDAKAYGGDEKMSAFMQTDLISILMSITNQHGIGHILTQSIGWRYEKDRRTKQVEKKPSNDENTIAARIYWQKHLKLIPKTDWGVYFAAQLCLIPGFADPDCCFAHKSFRKNA